MHRSSMNPVTDRRATTTSALFSLMLVFSSILVGLTPTVQAVGPNQNDMGMTSGDLPDNLSTPTTVPNLIFSGSVSGSGELVSTSDDYDYLRVALGSNEGLAAELSFASGDDFDLSIYDANQNQMANSYYSNPETVSTNSSSTNHGGMVYIEIAAYSYAGTSGGWNLTLTKFTVSNGTGGGGNGTGGGGGGSVTNCTGAGTLTSDILEPNDSTTAATSASLLPLVCTGLSIHNSLDVDYFEIDMTAGVTYYVNVTFNGLNGDLDTGWDTASGGFLDSSTSTGSLESMQVTATTNHTNYVVVNG